MSYYAQWHYAECHYAEGRYAECCYAECRPDGMVLSFKICLFKYYATIYLINMIIIFKKGIVPDLSCWSTII
jgi:hypothetical protein